MFTADQVWGLAIAADRINGGYLKEPVYDFEVDQRNPVKEANKAMVKRWLREGDFSAATAEDIERGRTVRHYFNGFLLKELSGKINDFEKQALKIAQKDEFTGRDMLDFAIVSCLPSVMLRDQARNELNREIRASDRLAYNEGDAVIMSIDVSPAASTLSITSIVSLLAQGSASSISGSLKRSRARYGSRARSRSTVAIIQHSSTTSKSSVDSRLE